MLFLKQTQKGFGMVEIVLGVSVLAFSLIGIMASFQSFHRMSYQNLRETQADFLLGEGAEAMRSIRDNGWSGISNLSTGTSYYLTYTGAKWATSTSNVFIDNLFERKVKVYNVYRDTNSDIAASGTLDAGTKKIDIYVAWLTPFGTSTKSIELYLSDI